MKKIRKISAILLAAIMLVCMFAVPTGAASIKTPKLFIENKGSTMNIYIDGIDSSYVKEVDKAINNKQKTIINHSGIEWGAISVGITVGSVIDETYAMLWFNILKDSYTIRDGFRGGLWFAGSDSDLFYDVDIKYYNNLSGLTKGYNITIKNKKMIDIINNHKKAKVTFEAIDVDDSTILKGSNGTTIKRSDYEFYVEYSDIELMSFFGDSSSSKESSSAPTKTKLTASTKNGKTTFKWDKADGAEKYQLCYSKDGGKTYKVLKTVSSSKTSASVTISKKGTYKFYVRSYKTVDGKKIYSKKSNIKTVTIK